MFCSYCGKQLGDSARFCSFCGKPVSGSVIRPVQAAEPVQPVEVVQPTQPVEQAAANLMGQTVEQEKVEQQISEPVIQKAEEAVEPVQPVELVKPLEQAATELLGQTPIQPMQPVSGQALSERPDETVNSATGKQLETPVMPAPTANVPDVSNVPDISAKKEPERKYTFVHLMMCLVSTAVFAIAAGIFAGLYFAGL